MLKRVDPSQSKGPDLDAAVAASPRPFDFEQLLAAARRQARVIAVAAGVGLLLGFAYVMTAVPLYTARTDILVDSAKDKNALSTSIAELTIDESAIESQVEVLKSERIARGVVTAMKLKDDPSFMASRESPIEHAFGMLRSLFNFSDWFVSREKSKAEDDDDFERSAAAYLQGNVQVSRVLGTYVLAVSYTSPDRDRAAAIANGFAEAYLTEQLDAKYDATRRAAGWLQTRIAELKQHSLDSDLAIQKFKAEKGLVVTGSDKQNELISDQQLTGMNAQIMAARADTARAEARYNQIEDLLKSGRVGAAVPDSLSNPVINELREKYLTASRLESQYEAKLGSSHLQVIAWKKSMEEDERLIKDELGRIAESYRSEVEVARAKERSLNESMAQLVGASTETNQALVQLRELMREADTYRTLYQTFMQRYQEAVQQQSFPITEARVISRAWPPNISTYPKRTKTLELSLLLGAMLGAGIGALREYRDRVFRVASQVRDELGLEFLGMLPVVDHSARYRSTNGERRDPKQVQLTDSLQRYSIDHPLSSFAETLRAAKVSADLALGERRPKIIGIISALPGEGKSTVAKNFASLLAHLGARTVLIDADLRNPDLTRGVARHADAGILEAIRGDRPVRDLLLSEPDSGLFVLPAVSKRRVQHSSEVISSPGMRNVFVQAAEAFDYIVVDLPPLGPIVDVRAAASLLDAFLFVVEWGRTPRVMVQNVLTSDEATYEKCLGVLYNKVNMKKVKLYENYGSKDYHYGRYSKYYHREQA